MMAQLKETLNEGNFTHGPALSAAMLKETEYLFDQFRLIVVHGELLLHGIALGANDHGGIAKGRPRTVPIALAGILVHGPENVLGVFLGLVLVKEIENLTDHITHGVFTDLLGDGDHADAALVEFAAVVLELVGVPEEAGEAVDDNHIKGPLGPQGPGQHRLEGRAAIIGGAAGTGFHKLSGDRPTTLLAKGFQLLALVRNGEVFFSLSLGRDP